MCFGSRFWQFAGDVVWGSSPAGPGKNPAHLSYFSLINSNFSVRGDSFCVKDNGEKRFWFYKF